MTTIKQALTALAVCTAGLSMTTTQALPFEACMRGINLAGAEFGQVGGKYGEAYTYPSRDTIEYFASQGFTTVRLPFLWERLQPKLGQRFDPEEFKRLKDAVSIMRGKGLRVVLDVHNYARYNDALIGSETVPEEDFSNLWKRLAKAFGDDGGVIFGLMNEPHGLSATSWFSMANGAIADIRKITSRNLILVPGTAWTGAHSWFDDWYGGANADAAAVLDDPADNYALEFHQYFDDDFSGKLDNCSRASDAVAAIERISGWLRERGLKGFLGEFGVTAEPGCIATATTLTEVIDRDSDVWLGWAYWAAGDMWPATEALNIQPTSAGDRAQLDGLRAALAVRPASRNCAQY